MALKITSEVATNGGVTSEAYLNIEKLTFRKNSSADVWVNLYLNQEARERNPNAKVISNQVPIRFGIKDMGSPSPVSLFSTDTLYQVAYDEIRLVLETRGLKVIDVI
jgi:hypothetical protein